MIPGPGSYDVSSSTFGEGPKYTLRSRTAYGRSAAQSPGPGYSPRALTQTGDRGMGDAPAYTMGVTRRVEEGKGAAPGPGTYSARHNQHGLGIALGDAPAFGFGTSAQRPPSHQARGARYISEEMAKRSTFGLCAARTFRRNYCRALPAPSAELARPRARAGTRRGR